MTLNDFQPLWVGHNFPVKFICKTLFTALKSVQNLQALVHNLLHPVQSLRGHTYGKQ
jgi:hypothetical protein